MNLSCQIKVYFTLSFMFSIVTYKKKLLKRTKKNLNVYTHNQCTFEHPSWANIRSQLIWTVPPGTFNFTYTHSISAWSNQGSVMCLLSILNQWRGFNGSVNISESCDFRSQFEPLIHNFIAFFLNSFLLAYTFWMKKFKINNSVSLKIVEI